MADAMKETKPSLTDIISVPLLFVLDSTYCVCNSLYQGHSAPEEHCPMKYKAFHEYLLMLATSQDFAFKQTGNLII
jgi:hypothetical protein